MKVTVRLVSTCGRELLRGWWRPIELMVSCMIFKASVLNILDRLSYSCMWTSNSLVRYWLSDMFWIITLTSRYYIYFFRWFLLHVSVLT
jgi:hypothetical protein